MLAIHRNAVNVLHTISLFQPHLQIAQKATQIVRMHQLSKRTRHYIFLGIHAEQAAETGADIQKPGRFAHFQQTNAAIQVFKQFVQ